LAQDLGPTDARGALETMNKAAAVSVRPDGYIQDEASQMVAAHLPIEPNATVLDMCAAPGGKTTALAAPDRGAGIVVAADLSLPRSRLVSANATRLGTEAAAVVVADGTDAPLRPSTFDLVLVDAPCSGLGVLRRRPDARWRVQPGDVPRLGELQKRLLTEARGLVRPGGVLAYSVCTLTALETAGIDNWLARTEPGLTPLPPPGEPWRPAGRGALLLPQSVGTDGMYLLTLRVG
jgi:16S rRNA (cytosine967-C5)-methyltransferase